MATVYTLEQCKKHISDKDCWLVVHGKHREQDFMRVFRQQWGPVGLGERGSLEPTPNIDVQARFMT